MAKLHFLLDGNSLGEFTLDKERMTIGRRPTSDIHIDNLAVSGEHAVVVTIGEDSFLEDLNSTNGTMVNHKSIKKHVLLHNDIIEFGKYQLKYINETQASAAPADSFEKTMIIRPTKADMNTEAGIKQAAQAKTDRQSPIIVAEANQVILDRAAVPNQIEMLGRLQVLNGNSAGKELLLNKAMVTLGKPGLQVAVITKRPHGYFITHVEGENHPAVNGHSIGLQAHSLNDHDVVELAGTKMEFYLA